MSFESLANTAKHELNPLDFADAFFDSSVKQPWNAIGQLAGQNISPSKNTNDSLAAKAGNIAGTIVDFTILSAATGGVTNCILREAAGGIIASSAKMFVAGSIYGGVLTPSATDRSLLSARLENAVVSGSTFAIMGGAGKALEGSKILGANPFWARVSSNSIAGGAGGVVDAYGSIYFKDHRLANTGEILSAAGQYAVFGAGFGALDYGLSKGAQKLSQLEPVQHAYNRMEWDIHERMTESRRLTYSILNKYDMRHPLQRVGKFVHGSDSVNDIKGPQLTPENNPVTAFEKELPQYFQQIKEHEQLLNQTAGNKEQYAIHMQMREIRTKFAHQLLTVWHGTPEQPGIASHSNSELSTLTITAERVAQVRNALTLTAQAKYPAPSPLTQALADLAQFDLSSSNHDNYGIARDMGIAKEKFFHLDEDKLSKCMSMPWQLHCIDHNNSTPLNWMPFEANSQLPNLFHGSVSNSLQSIFTERALLSSSELRLRGIEQVAGESFGDSLPRRAVSVTRDFNEAWAYHRHSPEYLTGYPVIFGISKDVIAKAWSAGMLEPGEILVDKLGLGNSLLTQLGLKRPEITHLFVPDGQVNSVSRQLSTHRIKGIQVLGLNELKTPEWKQGPKPTEDNDM